MEALPAKLHPALRRRAEQGAAWVQDQKASGRTVLVVHHIDADGVSSGAIAATALQRAGIPFVLQPVKSLDDVHVGIVKAKVAGAATPGAAATSGEREHAPGAPALWFCDLGSTAYMHFPNVPRLVCDHHQLVRDGTEESFAHCNPLLDGLSGEEVSGAGCAYLVAAALDDRNLDLLPLALVGAAADLQDRGPGRRFAGCNAHLVELGCAAGLLEVEEDLAWFGPETRGLRKYLMLASQPAIPTLTGNGKAAELLVEDAQVALARDGAERTWSSLDSAERRRLRSRIADRMLDCGVPFDESTLLRPVVRIKAEAPGRPTRELQEFGTLLNSTARYGKPDVGIAVAQGDRGARFEEALDLLLDHRKHLVGALDHFAQCGVREGRAVQWVHLQDRVLDTVVGIVAGMALDGLGLRKDLPLVAFAHTPDGRTKVSTRSPQGLTARGLDLAVAVRQAAELVGGQGGGHPGAAGATIARGREDEFLVQLDVFVGKQLGFV